MLPKSPLEREALLVAWAGPERTVNAEAVNGRNDTPHDRYERKPPP